MKNIINEGDFKIGEEILTPAGIGKIKDIYFNSKLETVYEISIYGNKKTYLTSTSAPSVKNLGRSGIEPR